MFAKAVLRFSYIADSVQFSCYLLDATFASCMVIFFKMMIFFFLVVIYLKSVLLQGIEKNW